jgi:hypothetical protein
MKNFFWMFVILLMIITLSSSIGGGIRYRENFLQEILELNDISNDALNDLQFDYNSLKKIEEEETITKPPTQLPPPPVPQPPTQLAPTQLPPTQLAPTQLPPTQLPPTQLPPTQLPPPSIQTPPRIRSPTEIPKPSPIQALTKSSPYIIEGYQGESFASF